MCRTSDFLVRVWPPETRDTTVPIGADNKTITVDKSFGLKTSGHHLRIVYITPNSLFPMDRGGRIRANHLWRAFCAFGEVTPLIVGDRPKGSVRSQLRRAGATFFPRRRYDFRKASAAPETLAKWPPSLFELNPLEPISSELLDYAGDRFSLNRHHLNEFRVQRIVRRVSELSPDFVYLCDTSLGVLAPYLRHLRTKIILGPHNFDSALYRSMSEAAPRDDLKRYYAIMADAFEQVERTCIEFVDQVWVCSAQDADRFRGRVADERIKVVPNVYDEDGPLEPAKTRNLVFIGQQQYFPNAVAASHLIKMSRALDGMNVAHTMQIVGRSVQSILNEAKDAPNVEVTGDVPEVTPYLADAAIVPIPLTLGGGTRLKVVEAMSLGRPIIATPIGIEGIDAVNDTHAIIEPDLDKFPGLIAKLLDDHERARDLGLGGHQLLKDRYSHEALLRAVEDAIRGLGLKSTPTSSHEVFAANIGLERSFEVAQFDPSTRLLNWSFFVRLAAPKSSIEVALVDGNGEQFPNGFVKVGREDGSWLKIEAEAVLPASISPEAVRVILWAWSREIGRFEVSVRLTVSPVGLISVEPGADGFEVMAWYSGGSATVLTAAGQKAKLPAPKSQNGVNVSTITTMASPREIIVIPDVGDAQKLQMHPHWFSRDAATTARLQHWKDRYKGETAWLVGNGPSVKVDDLEKLSGTLTFCFNRFHLAYPTMSFRPTFTVTADRQMIEDFGQEIVDCAGGTTFVADERLPDLLGDYVWLRLAASSLFSLDPTHVTNPGGSSLFVAMQIAHYMGIRRLFIYGADFKFNFSPARGIRDNFRAATGDGNHFIPNYRSGKAWCPPSLKDIAPSFQLARYLFAAHGGFIRNATRGGILEIFDRTPFEEAIRQSRSIQAGN